jgi:GT2 family glycosyltransferase
MSRQRAVVVLGMVTQMPVAGVVWQTLHYLIGLESLGFRAYYVEAHGRTPSMLMTSERDNSSARAASFLAAVMRRFGFGGRWAFRALHADGRCYGMSESELDRVCRSAELVLDLHGGTMPRPELTASDRLVYIETDPVQPEVELSYGLASTIEFLEQHCAHFTFAENYGQQSCRLPVSDRFDFQPTRQPVACDLWATDRSPRSARFTTIGNWRQQWRDVWLDGETYGWSKHQQFANVLTLPALVGRRFELALASCGAEEQHALREHGWTVIPALSFSTDLERYREYVRSSYGEFTAAKEQNVRLRTGWFSDRSATYLAAGRPVITENTGFGEVLPAGQGLFAFSSVEEAADAVRRIDLEPELHRRAAGDIAREFFSADVVLTDMLDRLGVDVPKPARTASSSPFPPAMLLKPLSRRPLALPEATLETVLAAPRSVGFSRRAAPAVSPAEPAASIVIVTHEGLPFTKLCLETLLAGTAEPAAEVLVVDNASRDGTFEYLIETAERDARVHIVANRENLGFPAACNQGLALARATALVLLNNDTMVAPGWLGRLLAALEDNQVGLVGPVTNRIGNEAEVVTSYDTWGGFLGEARARAHSHRGRTFEIPTVTMFCLAMRRDVYERLGPLDTRYGVGTVEDDDYSMRARRAGYRLVCAEDVLVHHFGEASFGRLYANRERERILKDNQELFEQKWDEPWQPYERRLDPTYDELVQAVCRRLATELPEDCTVLVVSKGDERLVEVPDRRAWHFPRAPSGVWAGYYPADSSEAITALEELCALGATHIAFPRTSLWWLDHYADLAHYLSHQHQEVLRDEACVVFVLRASGGDPSGRSGGTEPALTDLTRCP